MRVRLILGFLLLSARATAEVPRVLPGDVQLDPPLRTLPEGEDRIVPLQLREPAPFAGQLFSTDTALRWGFWLQQWDERYRIDIAHERNTCAVELFYRDERRKAELSFHRQVEDSLRASLLRSETARVTSDQERLDPGFLSSPGFYYGLGVVSAALLFGAGFWAAGSH